MNNSINYCGFTELFLDSKDEFEPYGYCEADAHYDDSDDIPSVFKMSYYKSSGYEKT